VVSVLTPGHITRVDPQRRGCGCGGDSCPSVSRSVIELSRVSLDLARGLLSGESYSPRHLALTAMRMGAASAQGIGAAVCGLVDSARWIELSNKLTTYRLFASADVLLPDIGQLPAVMQRLCGHEPYSRIWVTEGLGWYYADRTGCQLDPALPRHSLIPLHTGVGLALAQRAFKSCDGGSFAAVLDRFRKACGQVCVPGYEGAVFEAVGLVTITLYPELVREIEEALSGTEEAAYFWHGVGRGLYFSALSFVPTRGARRWAAAASQQMPLSSLGRENALAGLAWATTLVNIRNPEVLACCVRDLGDLAVSRGTFGNGVGSAMVIWRETSPRNEYLLERWWRFRPRDVDPIVWERAIVGPALDALRWYETVKGRNIWGKFFRAWNSEL